LKPSSSRRSNWFNHRRLLEPIGNIPPAEAEARYYALNDQAAMAAISDEAGRLFQ
jgi:hypothetical protein